MKKIIIFASGSGSNAQQICTYFAQSDICKVTYIATNNAKAGVIHRAEKLNIPCKIFSKLEFFQSQEILNWLKEEQPSLIVLAGFLWKIPLEIIQAFENKIINIHPSLLPKYGGKGMYGNYVHQAVLQNKEPYSGITIHYVNPYYDKGEIIFQHKVKVSPIDTEDTLAERIHKAEYEFFPKIIEKILKEQK